MCGRFTSKAKPEETKKEFKVEKLDAAVLNPRYNIAPSQMINVVFEPKGERILEQIKWGLIPSWTKDANAIKGLINARAETLREKPSFRDAFKSRRCIIPASGFYEWQKARGGKQPFYFFLKDKEVFGFAGLWESWVDKTTGEELETCTIITTEANDVLKPIHDRMPVILKAKSYDEWLDTNVNDTERLQKILIPYPADEMDSHAVGKSVNIPDVDAAELIQPLNSL